MTDIALEAALDRFEKAAFEKFANLPRGKAERAEVVASREAEYNSSREAIRAYLRASPSQVAPANPAQVTDAMVEVALKAFHSTRRHTTNRPAMRAALTAAIDAGGQAVAWLGEGDGFKSFTRSETTANKWRKGGIKVTAVSALPQPHPADERVVEALAALRIDRDNEAERKLRARHDKDTTMIAVHAYAEGVLTGHIKAFETALATECR